MRVALLIVALAGCRRDETAKAVEREQAASTCVDPMVDFTQRVPSMGSAYGDELERSVTADLDGDGAIDPILARVGYCGSGGCTWHVYRTNGGCARWAGSFFGDPTVVPNERHMGLADLDVTSKTETKRYVFDGSRYVSTR